ncbi:MAG: hypothetical protein JWN68_2788 [Nocardioides sp.]|jgi:hypothetical protein|uniref:hypothetical protein n=1 Tax=Nocardioides sp. TaxID=35761 RepID=UPI0026112697|nr:hypothetical protein [Nocardioides sp.]MCW2834835.1 hypothetical protein [Nocardioides sp.]
MGLRGLVAIVALLAAGIVGGFVAASYLAADPDSTGIPTPVAAPSPSIPGNPTAALQDDPTEPALPTDLVMEDVMVGSGRNAFVFPAPVDWSRFESGSNEVKYKMSGYPGNTFVLRVEQVKSQHEAIPDIVEDTLAELDRDFDDFKLTRRTYDSLEFNYLYEGYRRFGFLTWMDVSDSDQAEAEIAVTGREKDLTGMSELLAKVIRGIRTN